MKYIIFFQFLILPLMFLSNGVQGGEKQKKILLMVSTGFFAPEYYEPKKRYESEGYQVITAAKYNELVYPDKRQQTEFHPAIPDIVFEKVDVNTFDAITFAGGNGAWEDFFPNEEVHRILTQSFKLGKITALLCSSTGLLGVANNFSGSQTPIAAGRKVTGYYRVEGLIKVMGKANYSSGEPGKPFVVVDGNLITGRDPISSELFANTVIKALKEK